MPINYQWGSLENYDPQTPLLLEDQLARRREYENFLYKLASERQHGQTQDELLNQRLAASQRFLNQRENFRSGIVDRQANTQQQNIGIRADAQLRNRLLRESPAAAMPTFDLTGLNGGDQAGAGASSLADQQPDAQQAQPGPNIAAADWPTADPASMDMPPSGSGGPMAVPDASPQPPSAWGVAHPDTVGATQQQLQANQQIITGPTQAGTQKLMQAIQSGNLQAMQEGLRRGLLKFSDTQQTEIRRLQDAMHGLDMDKTMSPADRMRGQRILAQSLHSIRPQSVPPDQQPQDFATQVQQRIAVIADPVSGKPMKITVDRNGVPREFISEREKVQIKNEAELDLERQRAAMGLLPGGKPAPQKPGTLRDAVGTDPKAFNSLFDNVKKSLMQEKRFQSTDPEAALTPPNDQEIEAEMERRMQMHERMLQGRSGSGPTSGGVGGMISAPNWPTINGNQQQSSQPQMTTGGVNAGPQPDAPSMAAPPGVSQTSQQTQQPASIDQSDKGGGWLPPPESAAQPPAARTLSYQDFQKGIGAQLPPQERQRAFINQFVAVQPAIAELAQLSGAKTKSGESPPAVFNFLQSMGSPKLRPTSSTGFQDGTVYSGIRWPNGEIAPGVYLNGRLYKLRTG